MMTKTIRIAGFGGQGVMLLGQVLAYSATLKGLNAIWVPTYGMTGGQMAPTTLIGQKTTTSQSGRDPHTQGYPIKVSEMFQHLKGVAYVERVALTGAQNVNKVKKSIKKAFQYQLEGKGFTMIEVLSTCPVNWGMSPYDAMQWVTEKMVPEFPLGVYKDVGNDD